MASYTTIFFDFGNTLAPLNPIPHSQRLKRAFDEYGFREKLAVSFPDDDSLATIHADCHQRAIQGDDAGNETTGGGAWESDVRAYYQRWAALLLMKLGAPEPDAKQYAADFADAFRDLSDKTRVPFDDTVSTLDTLKDMGLKLAIVSNNDGRLRQRVEYLNLDRYFDLIVDSAIVRSNKPDPGIFHYALDQMAVSPSETLHVGDLYKADVVGAGGVGIDSAWLNRTGKTIPPDSRWKPTYIIHELSDLPERIAL